MASPAAQFALYSFLVVVGAILAFIAYAAIRYTPIISRIFEEKPMFLPLRVTPLAGAEDSTFRTRDGLELVGTYFRARTAKRLGVLVFCHEYLSDRWSALPYADHLRDRGFDLFSFDFRNHGQSQVEPSYKPLQWVTDHEVADLKAALAFLKTRPDADPAGVGLIGISRGGGTALCVAGSDPSVWAVMTDGAFPTRGTMLSYIVRWAEIFVGNRFLWKAVPTSVFEFLAWISRLRTQAKLNCRYANVERAVGRLSPRPWLAIHGQKDAYIGVDIARQLFAKAGGPKELWIVEGAKHNRGREKDPVAYAKRVAEFITRFAPRAQHETRSETPGHAFESVSLSVLAIPADLEMVSPG